MKKSYILFFVLLFIPTIFSLGVSPAKVELTFEPNLTHQFDFIVQNFPAKNEDVEIYFDLDEIKPELKDEFKKIISFDKTRFSFTEDEDIEIVKVSMQFPEGFSEGGIHELRVGARPVVKEAGLVFIAGNEIRVLITVPEEYADSKYRIKREVAILNVNADIVRPNQEGNISILVKSNSDIVVENIFAVVKIVADGTIIDTIETEKIQLSSGEERNLIGTFMGKTAGNYILNVEVYYDYDSVTENGFLRVIDSMGGLEIQETNNKIYYYYFLFFLILLLIILVLFFLFFLWRRRKKDEEDQQTNNLQQTLV